MKITAPKVDDMFADDVDVQIARVIQKVFMIGVLVVLVILVIAYFMGYFTITTAPGALILGITAYPTPAPTPAKSNFHTRSVAGPYV